MSEHNETLAEIVAEMRKRMKSYYYSREGRNLMRQYADRIEAAWRRERGDLLMLADTAAKILDHEREEADRRVEEVAKFVPVGNSAAWKALARIGEAINNKMMAAPTGVTAHERAIMNLCLRTFKENPQPPVGNSAAMREALEYLLKERDILDFCHNNLGSKTWEDWDKVYNVLRKIIEKAMRALAKPPRNCDMYQDGQSAYNGWRDSFRDKRSPELLFSDWIFETAKEKTDGSK